MADSSLSRRNLLALGAASVWAGSSCSEADTPIPKIVAALGETVAEVVARSALGSLEPPIVGEHGKGWGLDRPHQFLYDDGRLRLFFPTCGFDISMPSLFVFDDTNPAGGRPGHVLIRASVSVFGEYVPVARAMDKAHAILDDIARQVGEEPVEVILAGHKGDYDGRLSLPAIAGPEIFLDQQVLVSELSLQRKVGVNSIDIRVRNMNRTYSDLMDENLAEIERKRTKQELEAEPVYYLDFYIIAPFTL